MTTTRRASQARSREERFGGAGQASPMIGTGKAHASGGRCLFQAVFTFKLVLHPTAGRPPPGMRCVRCIAVVLGTVCLLTLRQQRSYSTSPIAVAPTTPGNDATDDELVLAAASQLLQDEGEDEGGDHHAADTDAGTKEAFNATAAQRDFGVRRQRGPLHFDKRRIAMSPTLWRRNRKKLTELTSITSVKRNDDAATADDAPPTDAEAAQRRARSDSNPPSSTLQWLSDHWSGSTLGAGGPAASSGAESVRATSVETLTAKARAARVRRRRRWRAHGSERLCIELQRRHGVIAGTSWGTLPLPQQRAWQALACDRRVGGGGVGGGGLARPRVRELEHSGGGGGSSSVGTDDGVSGDGAPMQAEDFATNQHGRPRARSVAGGVSEVGYGIRSVSADDRDAVSPAAECDEMARAHNVLVGVSWGSLPDELQGRWTQLGCDVVVRRDSRRSPRGIASAAATVVAGDGAPSRQHVLAGRAEAGLSCLDMQLRHSVVVGQSWGTLPAHLQQRWARLICDQDVKRR